MGKYCSDCTYFNPNDKKTGVNGHCKCSKLSKIKKKDTYVLANQVACDKFNEAYARKWFERETLYNDAKKIPPKEDPISLEVYTFIAIVLVILAFIINIV